MVIGRVAADFSTLKGSEITQILIHRYAKSVYKISRSNSIMTVTLQDLSVSDVSGMVAVGIAVGKFLLFVIDTCKVHARYQYKYSSRSHCLLFSSDSSKVLQRHYLLAPGE